MTTQTAGGAPVPLEEVIVRLMEEGPITIAQGAKLCPPVRGKKSHASKLYHWITRGKRGIRLEGYKSDGTWWTSRAALARFHARLTRLDLAELPSMALEQEQARKQRSQIAAEKVRRLGRANPSRK